MNNRIKRCIVFILFILVSGRLFSQLKVGNNVTNINANSILELESTNQGFVLPRLSLSSVNSSSPLTVTLLTGTVVYNTNSAVTGGGGAGLYYWDGNKWNFLSTATALGGNYWNLSGNSGTNSGNNYVGTNDNQPLVFKVNSVSAGYLGLSGASYATSLGVGASGSSTAFQSTAIGAGAQATGSNASLAVGYNAVASAQDAIAIGESAVSSTNNEAIAIGHNTSATSFQGIAIGATAKVSTNNQAIAIGYGATATGFQSTALGNGASAVAQNSTAIGNGAASAQVNSLILGNSLIKVGILTNTPTMPLDVNGTINTGKASGSNGVLQFTTSNTSGNTVSLQSGVTATSYALTLPTAIGTTGQALSISGISGTTATLGWSNLTNNSWLLTGNSGTTASTSIIGTAANNNFIGTVDAKDWIMATSGFERMRIGSLGNIGIQTTPGAANLLDITSSSAANAFNVTTGNIVNVAGNTLTSGTALNIASNSTAGIGSGSSYLLKLNRSGANTSGSHTAYGINSNVINTGTTSTNIAGYFSASGATNNYGIIVPSSGGYSGFNTASPNSYLDVAGSFGTSISTIAAATTLDASYSTVLATPSSAYTVTLPVANTAGRRLYKVVYNGSGSNIITISRSGSDNISSEGSSLTTLALTGGSVTLQSDGASKWYVVENVTTAGNYWSLAGNAATTASSSAIGTTANNNFIGTTDGRDFILATSGFERMRIGSLGNIGIQTTPGAANLLDITSSSATNAFNVTTGNIVNIAGNTLTSGVALNITSASTAGLASGSSYLLKVSRSGVNAAASHTAYGVNSSISNTGTTSTNIAGYFSASGATNNYGLIVPSGGGNVGIGTLAPVQILETMNGNILINNNNNSSGEFRIAEPSTSGTDYTAFKTQAQAAAITYTLPASQGGANTVLTNDGTGILKWGTGSVQFKTKASNESVTSNTTLQDDNDFSFSLGANQTYEIFAMIRVSCADNGLLKMQFAGPTGASEFINVFVNRSAQDDVSWVTSPTTAYQVATSAVSNTTDVLMLNGTITTVATSGTFKLQWAQQLSSTTATTYYSGSYMKVTLVK